MTSKQKRELDDGPPAIPLADGRPACALTDEERRRAVTDPDFVRREMRDAHHLGGGVERVSAIAKADVKMAAQQSAAQHAAAATTYAEERAHFSARHACAAAAYKTAAAAGASAERIGAVAFFTGFVEGLAATKLDPAHLVQHLAVDFHADKLALHNVVEHARGHYHEYDSEFPESMREHAEEFLKAVLPLVLNLKTTMVDLSALLTELTGPLMLVDHIVEMAAPPFLALALQLAKDAFHIARKSDRDADIAAVHFLIAAWDHRPRRHEEWHEIGHNIGILCLAIVGV